MPSGVAHLEQRRRVDEQRVDERRHAARGVVVDREDRREVRAHGAHQREAAGLRAVERALVRAHGALAVGVDADGRDQPGAAAAHAVGARGLLLEPPGRGPRLAHQDALVDPALEGLAGLGLVARCPGRIRRTTLYGLRSSSSWRCGLVDHVVGRRDDVGGRDAGEVVAERPEGADDGRGPGCLRHVARVAAQPRYPLRQWPVERWCASSSPGRWSRRPSPSRARCGDRARTAARTSTSSSPTAADACARASGRPSSCSTAASRTGDTVRVLGRVGSYEGKVELELRDVERLPDGDPLELVPGARRDVDDLDGYLDFLIAEIHDDALRAVVEGDPLGRGLPRALPRRRGDRVGTSRLRRRPDRAHRGGHGALPRDRAVAAGTRHRRPDGGRAAARLRHARRARRRAGDPPERRGTRARPRAHRPAPHRGGRRAHAAARRSACLHCSRASPRTTGRPRAGASRAPRQSRCTPRTPSTRGSPRRAARSASSSEPVRRAQAGGGTPTPIGQETPVPARPQ